MRLGAIFSMLFFTAIIASFIYGAGIYFHFNMGNITDWIFGIASFFWLLTIVTIPWNMHFQAKEILADVEISKQKEIKVREEDIAYAKKIAKRYLVMALLMHLISAVVFYVLAYFEVSSLGYWSSIAALLLTVLRPAVRLHDYIIHRLQNIREQIRFPREDVHELKAKLTEIENCLKTLEARFDKENPASEYSQNKNDFNAVKNDLRRTKAELENVRTSNQAEHEQLKKQAEEAVSRLSEDARFLNQVRELIHFIKKA